MQPIARSITTARGTILIREAKPTDAAPFRELRLEALQDSPVAFTADYQRNLSHPPKYWEDILTTHPDEATMFLVQHQRSTTPALVRLKPHGARIVPRVEDPRSKAEISPFFDGT